MGTDIHTIAQVKRGQKRWDTVAVYIADDPRSYDTFAVLANIRNGTGFAGVVTGERWKPISQPRGFPEDLEVIDDDCVFTPYSDEKIWLGDHSHSWVTLAEIKHYLWSIKDKTYKVTGVLTYENYMQDDFSRYSGDVYGGRVNVITEEQAQAGEIGTHVRATWREPCDDRLWALKRYAEELQDIATNYAAVPGEVRLVFGFDS